MPTTLEIPDQRRNEKMRKLIVAALLVMGLSAVALAQQNEGRNAPARSTGGVLIAPAPDTDNRPYSRAFTGRVLTVNTETNEIVVEQPKVGAIRLALNKSTRIKADKNTDLADRRDLSLADYKPGQTVKVTYRLSDNKVLEIRLKPATK
jgi:hypothetical protein